MKAHGKDTGFILETIDNTLVDLSEWVTEVEGPPGTKDLADSTGMRQAAKTWRTGHRDADINVKGLYDPAALAVDEILFALYDSGSDLETREFRIGYGGIELNKVGYTGQCELVTYNIGSTVGGMVTFSASFKAQGHVARMYFPASPIGVMTEEPTPEEP